MQKILTISIVTILLCGYFHADLTAQTNDDFNRLSQVTRLPVKQRIPALLEMLKEYPDWIVARYALGVAYYSIKEFELVIPNFTKVLASGQKIENVNISEYLALAHHEVAKKQIVAKRNKEAISHLKTAIKLSPGKAAFYTNLGICYYNTGDYNLAKSVTQRAIKLSAKTPNEQGRAYYYLGHIYNAIGDFEIALQSYKRATELNPKLKNVQKYIQHIEMEQEIARLFKKAEKYIETGNARDAIALLLQVIEYDPNHLEARRLIADARSKLRADELKEKAAKTTTKKVENTPQPVVAKIKNDQRKPKKTRPVPVRETIEQRQRKQAVAFFNRKKLEEAAALFTSLLKKNPADKISRRYLTRIDSINSARQPELLVAKTPDITAGNPSPLGIDSAKTRRAEKSANKSEPELSPAKRGDGFSVARSRMIYSVLAGSALLIFIGMAIYFWQQRRSKPAFNITEKDFRAIESRIDAAGITDEKKSTGSSGIQRQVQHSNIDSPEEMEEASSGQAMIDVVAKDESETESPVDDDPNVFTTSFSAQDEEDFLKLVNDEEARPVGFQHEDTGSDSGSESTQTLEMSQFQVKKIGRYVIECEIGRGAAGRVYKAWDPKLDRTVVIKTVSYSLTASAEEIKRLKARVYREARAAAKLSHPNIVIVYDVEDESSFSYIVMEYIQGTDLSIMLNQRKKIDRALAVKLVLQTCKALQFAHDSGVIHRDIKPSNIMIVEKNTVKVTDFGIAKISNNLTLTQTGRVVGTPSYMAPEQIEGKEVDGRADVFSLGVVLYELLTGQRPFTGDTLASLAYKLVHIDPPQPSQLNKNVPPIFDEIISRSICKNPNDRFQSADEFYKALSKVKVNSVS